MRRYLTSLVCFLAASLSLPPAVYAGADTASAWVEGHSSRARLIASGGMAGVELQLPDGWKTYWRFPGEAGGTPPSFDWSKSTNLESAQVLYPAPKRFSDAAGDTLGYKGTVVFPVRLKAKDASKPIDVHLAFDYGVCKDICIPAEAEISLAVSPGETQAPSGELAEGLNRVPVSQNELRAGDPRLKRAITELSDAKPRLLLEIEFPGGAEHADAFIEAPDGLYVPQPKEIADDGKGGLTFEVDLSKDTDVAALKGKQLTATFVSDKGQSEATFALQ